MSENKISPDLLARARIMYMEYKPTSDIAKELEINRTSLQYYVNSKWREERDIIASKNVHEFGTSKKVLLHRMSEASMAIITKSLESLAKRETPPTVQEAHRAAAILETLEKLQDRDSSKNVTIEQDQITTEEELKKRLASDPFSSN